MNFLIGFSIVIAMFIGVSIAVLAHFWLYCTFFSESTAAALLLPTFVMYLLSFIIGDTL